MRNVRFLTFYDKAGAYCYKEISQYFSWPQNINMFNVNKACFNENKVQIDTGMLL